MVELSCSRSALTWRGHAVMLGCTHKEDVYGGSKRGGSSSRLKYCNEHGVVGYLSSECFTEFMSLLGVVARGEGQGIKSANRAAQWTPLKCFIQWRVFFFLQCLRHGIQMTVTPHITHIHTLHHSDNLALVALLMDLLRYSFSVYKEEEKKEQQCLQGFLFFFLMPSDCDSERDPF